MTMSMLLNASQTAMAAESNPPIMRIFEFVLAPSDVQPILEAGRKNIEASVRDEPGVLSMYCAVDKDNPTKVYVVEVYRNQTAYQAHVESAHFKAFLEAIKGKVRSRRVIETTPAVLGAKAFHWP
ncbi:antibiotic biosynthesis monooxygenase [Xylella taiwanensis]|uniref:Antibiotic biosynthesis monooxygenase n=3 Tax=Xylella taiwanensis TaxID=1444770 RepID=A0ABS8TTF0_9GAMM|nr:putative quinol monooxygenase [Xylella taiwanensis]AXI82939.1 antibiotic biosynthesis monooxygenase [Xylella taiwanensis]MCD8470231.1 antibiotic biosynthesis monooxygenase [Xylella taiwanensis]MCD8473302.1 antibiotic biosynthesis monooxygenase [Xylella taiwanensis]NBI37472.1 antibiotic biosynthesis monooxygenase [Xylella taiwanensis]QKD99479.1 antibiotic biosynthesis monooxygenase [Xylella taiwanensis]